MELREAVSEVLRRYRIPDADGMIAGTIVSLIDEERRALVKQNYDLAVLSDANLKAAEARCSKLAEALKKCLEALDHINCGVHDADAEFLARASARAALAAPEEGK